MRTSVDIPEALHKRLLRKARQDGTTIRALLLPAAEIAVEDHSAPVKKLQLPLVRSKQPGTLKITNQQVNEILFP